MVCMIEGTYTSVKDDEFVKYLVDSGIGNMARNTKI